MLVDGKPVSACSVLAIDVDGAAIETIEGLSKKDELHPLQEAFMEFGALQCGYCTSGFILTAKALLDECPHPSEEQIRDYLAGNFCRCGCYQEIMQAVKNVSGGVVIRGKGFRNDVADSLTPYLFKRQPVAIRIIWNSQISAKLFAGSITKLK